MIKFSVKNQAFYDDTLGYLNPPKDLIVVTGEQHKDLLNALNSGCIVFSDLSHSDPKPSKFHIWSGSGWVDSRTNDEIAKHNRSLLPPLTKRQFSLYLFDIEKYDQVMDGLNANPRFKIEFDAVTNIERLSPTVSAMGSLLGWSNEEIDVMWEQAALL